MNTSNYFYWNKVLSTEEIKNINSLLDKHKKEKEPSHLKSNVAKKTSTVYPIKIKFLKEYLKKILNFYIIEANQHHYGYDIFNFNDENELHYNIYKKGEEYEWHMDAEVLKNADVKLTVLINISDNFFSGGEFNLLTTNKPTVVSELSESGSMIMFNSFFLHKVNPVTKGTRKTLTLFVKGPSFK
jgi:predicted 2-oxoglutarate/Fe(II)-dependent dioxygenase YbiX